MTHLQLPLQTHIATSMLHLFSSACTCGWVSPRCSQPLGALQSFQAHVTYNERMGR
jgi:hypothetical protein